MSDDYEKALAELDESEGHYEWRCPFDLDECRISVEGLRFGVCRDKALGLVCPRYDERKVGILRCHDSEVCNKFVEGFGFGACRDKYAGGKLRVCCSRF